MPTDLPLFDSEPGWRPCPGGPVTDVDLERSEGRCPSCEYTFSTLMDEPTLPPHYVSADGRVVIFDPKPSDD
jgi:hypothetical protein